MKILSLILLLSALTFGQSGKSVLTQAQITKIDSMIAASISADSLGYVTPQTFGAVADGVTDDYSALSSAIDYAKTNKVKLFLPTGTYKVNTEISKTILDGEYLEIEGQNAIIDGSGLDVAEGLMSISGDDNTGTINLTANVSKGDTVIPIVTTGKNIDVGDVVIIKSSQYWFYDTKKGEIKKVKAVTDTSITVYGILYDNYTSATTSVRPLKSNGLKISGIHFKHNNINAGLNVSVILELSLMQNVVVERCTFSDNMGMNLLIENCFNVRIDNITSHGTDQYGYGYGVMSGGSDNVLITNSTIEGSRHAVTTGYGTPHNIPNRNLIVDHCFVSNSKGYNGALDTHASSEGNIFSNNIIFGGINIRDVSVTIEGNKIFPRGTGITITETDTMDVSERVKFYIIRNNDIDCIDTTESIAGISYTNTIGVTVDDFIIENNRIKASNVGIQLYALNSAIINNLSLSGNKIKNYKYADSKGFFITGAFRINKLIMDNEQYVSNDNGVTANITSTDTIKFIEISNSNFRTNTAQSLYLGAGIDKARLHNNHFYNNAYNDIYVRDFVSLTNNYYEYKGYNIRSAVDTLYYSNNFLNPSFKSLSTNSATITITEDNSGVEASIVKPVASVTATGLTTAMINGKYIKVVGSGGAVDITTNPQIADGILDGQEIYLIGTSNSNTVKFDNGDGLDLGDPSISYTLGSGDILGLVWISADDLWHRLPNTAIEPKTGQLLLSVGVDTTTLEPSRVLLTTSRIDSIGAMVRDSSVSWTLKTGTDWNGTLTNVFGSNKTTTTNTMAYYTDFDDYIAKNNMFFLEVDSSAGTIKEGLKVEVFYSELTFHPMELSPLFYGYNTVEDANNKITEWTDRTSNNNDFLQSDTSKSPLLVGGELTFNGVDDHLTIGDDASFDFGTSDVSIEGWVKTDNGTGIILSKYIGTNDVGWWFGEQSPNGRLLFAIYHGDGNSSIIVTSDAISDNGWHHIAVSLDRNVGAYLYIDGVLVQSEATTEWTDISALDVTTTNNCFIGTLNNTASYFDGNISNLRFYNVALTQTDITNLYNFGR